MSLPKEVFWYVVVAVPILIFSLGCLCVWYGHEKAADRYANSLDETQKEVAWLREEIVEYTEAMKKMYRFLQEKARPKTVPK